MPVLPRRLAIAAAKPEPKGPDLNLGGGALRAPG
jgi:hypothetical protein